MRRVEFNLSGGSYHPPPRITLAVPLSGPFGFLTCPRTKPSANQSDTHSEVLPARSCAPYALLPAARPSTGARPPLYGSGADLPKLASAGFGSSLPHGYLRPSVPRA